MRSRQRVPLPAPLEDEHGGEVRDIGDRPVRVPPLDPRLAAPVRLYALANLAVGVLRPARLEISSLRHVPVRRLAVEDPTRADDARQADVDHTSRRLDVEPDAEAEEEHRRGGERPGRPDRPEGFFPLPDANPCAPHEEVPEHRVHQWDAAEDLPTVEECERDREREQHEQVEVPE